MLPPAVLILLGLALRAYASGFLRKDSALTTTGPYAYTRNPLYLGSAVMAAGFALAARSFWIAFGMLVIFVAIYLPVIGFEESFLRSLFLQEFDAYSQRVPRFFPRFSADNGRTGSGFSFDLYLKNREYNALIGAAAVLAAVILKLLWFSH
jgi:protein-S-isoprenylcysteine O-methyltransferase Ste14